MIFCHVDDVRFSSNQRSYTNSYVMILSPPPFSANFINRHGMWEVEWPITFHVFLGVMNVLFSTTNPCTELSWRHEQVFSTATERPSDRFLCPIAEKFLLYVTRLWSMTSSPLGMGAMRVKIGSWWCQAARLAGSSKNKIKLQCKLNGLSINERKCKQALKVTLPLYLPLALVEIAFRLVVAHGIPEKHKLPHYFLPPAF